MISLSVGYLGSGYPDSKFTLRFSLLCSYKYVRIFLNIFYYIANLSLSELRCLYFQLKDKVFHRVWDILPHGDTVILEEMIKSLVSEHRKLGCKTYPK